jgi:hypothetical protein
MHEPTIIRGPERGSSAQFDGDTAEALITRAFEAECEAYPEAIALWTEQPAKTGGAEAP